MALIMQPRFHAATVTPISYISPEPFSSFVALHTLYFCHICTRRVTDGVNLGELRAEGVDCKETAEICLVVTKESI